MSAYTWGSKTLNMLKNSYKPPIAAVTITEIPLIPLSGDSGAMSVLQQGGRARKRASLQGFASETDFQALEADLYAGEVRTFTDADGNSFDAMIESLSASWVYGVLPYEYSITFLEV